ncbi:MAG: hypothetical protein ACO1NY_12370 [Pseudorhodoplanes sp.]
MNPILRLVEDVFSGGAAITLAAEPRMIFVLHGTIAVAGKSFIDGEAWSGEGAAEVVAGPGGAMCWRYELSASVRDDGAIANGVASRTKLAAPLEYLPAGGLLLRGDSVAFPPGGVAYLHRHQGPGIRCLIEGGIRIDTHGRSTSYGPGGAWFESGPEPVFAQAALDRPSRFIRAMILPQSLLGKSSIQYVNDEDKAKPKSQSYKVYADLPIASGAR